MHTIHRVLVSVALLVWLAIPAIGNGGGGGENAGGTGVWILPRAMPLAAGALVRDSRVISNLSQDQVLGVSAECGAVVATFVDEMTSVATALPVSGSFVRIPRALMQAMVATNCPKANIVVADQSQVGYLLELVLVPASGSIAISVR